MSRLTLKIGQDTVEEYDFQDEGEAVTVSLRLIDLSNWSWDYNSETKTWSCDDRTMQITEV